MLSDENLKKYFTQPLAEAKFQDLPNFYQGKVRENYSLKDGKRILIATDRVSAFDRVLGTIPLKGQVLNRLAKFWFDKTADIIHHHVLDIPDPNVTVAKELKGFPVEMIIRGYLTGSTATSAWKNYEKGERKFCGVDLPEGLKKNDSFPEPIITPTTKAEVGQHDEKISKEEIIAQGLVSADKYEKLAEYTKKLFARGQEIAQAGGLILVDTKYEFGQDETGEIRLMDEIHTPDSSRFWVADTYQEKIKNGLEPDNFDKEFLRLWFEKRCDPYHDQTLPAMTDEFRLEVMKRYIETYERITQENFIPSASELPPKKRIYQNLKKYIQNFSS